MSRSAWGSGARLRSTSTRESPLYSSARATSRRSFFSQACAEADRWTTQLAFQLEKASPDGFEVFNRGIGGNTTALALDRIQNDVIPLLPGLVLIEFGINDAYVFPWAKIPRVALSGYMENLAEILRQVRAAHGEAVLIINHQDSLSGGLIVLVHLWFLFQECHKRENPL